MTCAEFQQVLPYIIETGGNPDEEDHLRTCQVCSDLVRDLKYIVDQAKLLVPMEEPSPKVWKGIRGALEQEGMVRPRGSRGRLLKNKGNVPWIVALGVLLIMALASRMFTAELHFGRNPGHPTAAASQLDVLSGLQQEQPANDAR